MIGIINYGVGNLRSVKNSLDYLGIPNTIVTKPQEIDACDKIILPGVGAFGPAMEKLNASGFSKKIKEFVRHKPILGICLGMQLLFDEGHEHGIHGGLGLIKGKVLSFNDKVGNLPLPQIGWNDITKDCPSPLLGNIENGSSFYFVHSFYCEPTDKSVILASAEYGIKFTAIVGQDKIFGCQFHPEKSQVDGLKLLVNFNELK